jgi:hypothetical protein
MAIVAFVIIGPGASAAQTARVPQTDDPDVQPPHATGADTGRMVWGHQEFSRYTDAAPCDRAVENAIREVRRDKESRTREPDTLPPFAVAVARACGRHLAEVDAEHYTTLWSLFRLSLASGDDDRAARTLERLLSNATPATLRPSIIASAIEMYVRVKPSRLETARGWIATLDSMQEKTPDHGAPVRIARYQARISLMAYYYHRVYDVDRIRSYADEAISIFRKMPVEERDRVDALPPYLQMIDLANDRGAITDQQRLLHETISTLARWRSGAAYEIFKALKHRVEGRVALYGTQGPVLPDGMWFNQTDSLRSQGKKPSLIIRLDPMCGAQCASLYAMLRDIAEKYESTIDVILIVETVGYLSRSAPLAPELEARERARYLLEFWKIPGVLLVDHRSVGRYANGMVGYNPGVTSSLFQHWSGGNIVLLDASNTIRWIGAVTPHTRSQYLASVINSVLSLSASPSP